MHNLFAAKWYMIWMAHKGKASLHSAVRRGIVLQTAKLCQRRFMEGQSKEPYSKQSWWLLIVHLPGVQAKDDSRKWFVRLCIDISKNSDTVYAIMIHQTLIKSCENTMCSYQTWNLKWRRGREGGTAEQSSSPQKTVDLFVHWRQPGIIHTKSTRSYRGKGERWCDVWLEPRKMSQAGP